MVSMFHNVTVTDFGNVFTSVLHSIVLTENLWHNLVMMMMMMMMMMMKIQIVYDVHLCCFLLSVGNGNGIH